MNALAVMVTCTCTIINAQIIGRVIQGVSHIILHVLILYSYFVLTVFML